MVQPEHVEAACDAPRQTVSSQEEESFLQSVFERVSVCFPELALTMAVNSSGSTEFIESTKLSPSFLFIHLLFRGFFVVGCRSSPLEAPLLGAFFVPLFIGAAMIETRAVSNKFHVQRQMS